MVDDVKRPLQSILIGSSLTPQSDPVVGAAVHLARVSGADLHLVHAYAPPLAYFATPTGFATFDAGLLEAEEEAHRRMLGEQLERVGVEAGVFTSTAIAGGAPHRLVLEEARSVEADLLVVGSRETDRPRWLGSTADRVLRQAPCPVWVVRGESAMPPRRVLAPVDLSPHSEDSLRRGLALLDGIGAEPEIALLFVVLPIEREGSGQFTPEQIDRMANEEVDRFLARVDPETRRKLHPEVRVGEPRAEIVQDLGEGGFDLVLLGTHGRGGFERFLIGSVAADVAERSPTSVLVIPPTVKTDRDEEE